MDEQRRQLLSASAATLIAAATAQSASAQATPSPTPSVPPGNPGEFDFLHGEWRIHHRRLRTATEWEEFDGEATCWTILNGVGSVEELRVSQRNFIGMGLRLLDVQNRVWSDFWVNGASGVLTPPGMPGGFIDGAGIFEVDEMDGDQSIKVRGIWDSIVPGQSCRWRQAVSRDAGANWAYNWLMDWRRVGELAR